MSDMTNQQPEYRVENLPDVDQWAIKRGRCPWCLGPIYPSGTSDMCPECGDLFTGQITVED